MNVGELAQRQGSPRKVKLVRAMEAAKRYHDYHNGDTFVSVGGLDSYVLLNWLRAYLDPTIPGASVFMIEPKANQDILRTIENLAILKPLLLPKEIVSKFGFPVVSKDTAKGLAALQNHKPNNYISRRAYLTGFKGDGTYSKYLKVPEKWLHFTDKGATIAMIEELLAYFAAYDLEQWQPKKVTPTDIINDLTRKLGHLQTVEQAKIKVSHKCCYYMKEKPLLDYARKAKRKPFMGLMASEGGSRETGIMDKGCTIFEGKGARCLPWAYMDKSDILAIALEMELPISKSYGEIIHVGANQWDDPLYETTLADRTGCPVCGFGLHLEERPHRFDRMQMDNPKEYDFYVNTVGWGEVMDQLGVTYDIYKNPIKEV